MLIIAIIIIIFVLAIICTNKSVEVPVSPQFLLTKIKIETLTMFFSQLKNTVMTTVTHKDVDAMGKKIIATFTLPKNAAGNTPDLVPGSLRATSSNEEVATASIGAVDATAGTYDLEIFYPGKKGSADCKLIASPDVDGSGDADIEGMVTSVITTDEASGFGEAAVSELQ